MLSDRGFGDRERDRQPVGGPSTAPSGAQRHQQDRGREDAASLERQRAYQAIARTDQTMLIPGAGRGAYIPGMASATVAPGGATAAAAAYEKEMAALAALHEDGGGYYQPTPQHQMPMPQQRMPMPQQQMPMPQHQMPMPQHQMPMPQHQMPMPQQQMPPGMMMQLQQGMPMPMPRQK